MNHRIRTTAAGTALLTTGILAGLAIGSPAATATTAGPAPSTIAMPVTDMPMTDMNGTADMMTDVAGMAQMMGSAGMGFMHTAMHRQMADVMDPDVLAACDSAHDQMATATDSVDGSTLGASDDQHEAHHEGAGS